MKNLKIFHWQYGQLRDGGGRFKKSKTAFVLSSLLFLGIIGGSMFFPSTQIVYSEKLIKDTSPTPIMEKIAMCESNGKHTGESGQVLMKANTNGTVDVGKYQINTVWFKKANELGYNLTNEKDNELFAIWLYENQGSEPWIHSKKCWIK